MKTVLQSIRWVLGSALLTGALSTGLIGLAFSDNSPIKRSDNVTQGSYSAQAQTYQEECSACHIAYPAQLLPARSWRAVLGQLDDHFGENAELMPDTQAAIESFLVANAADMSGTRLGKKALRGLSSSQTPLRITKLPFYTRQHHEVPDKYVTGNPEVGSFSQCQACHGAASERGIFDEDTVKIPGVRRWDD